MPGFRDNDSKPLYVVLFILALLAGYSFWRYQQEPAPQEAASTPDAP